MASGVTPIPKLCPRASASWVAFQVRSSESFPSTKVLTSSVMRGGFYPEPSHRQGPQGHAPPSGRGRARCSLRAAAGVGGDGAHVVAPMREAQHLGAQAHFGFGIRILLYLSESNVLFLC